MLVNKLLSNSHHNYCEPAEKATIFQCYLENYPLHEKLNNHLAGDLDLNFCLIFHNISVVATALESPVSYGISGVFCIELCGHEKQSSSSSPSSYSHFYVGVDVR